MTYTATGYFKVVATVHSDVSDHETFRGPTQHVDTGERRPPLSEHGPDRAPGYVINWVYPFNGNHHEGVQMAREAAERKLRDVTKRCCGADKERVKLSQIGISGREREAAA